MGANITNVVIIEKGVPQLFRDLSLGGYFFTENMRKELNVPFEEAEKAPQGHPREVGVPADQFQTVLTMNIRDLLDEMEKTFSFYEAGEKRERKIEQIFLSGGLANVPNMVGAFEQKFRIKSEIFNPFRNIPSTRRNSIPFISTRWPRSSGWPSDFRPERRKNDSDQSVKTGNQGDQGSPGRGAARIQGQEEAAASET